MFFFCRRNLVNEVAFFYSITCLERKRVTVTIETLSALTNLPSCYAHQTSFHFGEVEMREMFQPVLSKAKSRKKLLRSVGLQVQWQIKHKKKARREKKFKNM